jgi:hypothetical protein
MLLSNVITKNCGAPVHSGQNSGWKASSACRARIGPNHQVSGPITTPLRTGIPSITPGREPRCSNVDTAAWNEVVRRARHNSAGAQVECAAPMSQHSGRIIECGKQIPDDSQSGFLAPCAGDLPANHLFEPGRAEPTGAGQIRIVTTADHTRTCHPALRSQRLTGGFERCRPQVSSTGSGA